MQHGCVEKGSSTYPCMRTQTHHPHIYMLTHTHTHTRAHTHTHTHTHSHIYTHHVRSINHTPFTCAHTHHTARTHTHITPHRAHTHTHTHTSHHTHTTCTRTHTHTQTETIYNYVTKLLQCYRTVRYRAACIDEYVSTLCKLHTELQVPFPGTKCNRNISCNL